MSIEHKNIPEDGLHEPKGASTAASDRVYISDGLGSGQWSKVDADTLQGVINNATAAGEFLVADGAGGVSSQEAISSDDVTYDVDTLTATIVDLQAQIDALDARVTALENP